MGELTLDEAIGIAIRECKDQYAQTYLRAIPQARYEFGEHGVKAQLLYCLNNMRSWRGETARQVKDVFKKHSK